jgi:hypothetical protein
VDNSLKQAQQSPPQGIAAIAARCPFLPFIKYKVLSFYLFSLQIKNIIFDLQGKKVIFSVNHDILGLNDGNNIDFEFGKDRLNCPLKTTLIIVVQAVLTCTY